MSQSPNQCVKPKEFQATGQAKLEAMLKQPNGKHTGPSITGKRTADTSGLLQKHAQTTKGSFGEDNQPPWARKRPKTDDQQISEATDIQANNMGPPAPK